MAAAVLTELFGVSFVVDHVVPLKQPARGDDPGCDEPDSGLCDQQVVGNVLAMLLASFDIEAVDTPDGGPAKELMAFTMNPVGLSMRLKERA